MKVAIIGAVGVPARYGGFETLADNLVRRLERLDPEIDITVYCSAREYPDQPQHYRSARLRYVPFNANGAQSVPYDIWSLFDAVSRRHDVLLLLGVSGALALPVLRRLTPARIVTNIDGVEWRREKWTGFARSVLKLSEALATRYSDVVIADNQGIADYVEATYGVAASVIAYGGDHAVAPVAGVGASAAPELPDNYALALCRIEPENNVAMILEAYAQVERRLVFVGNWDRSAYGRDLKESFGSQPGLTLMDPVYDPAALQRIRRGASVYVHGHSAGGTNPALVEMMHFGIPVLAYDCVFNRHTTENRAHYFASADALAQLAARDLGAADATMLEIAERRYTWEKIADGYARLFRQVMEG